MTTQDNQPKITSVLLENRSFPPPEAFQQQSSITSEEQYQALWEQSVHKPEKFWSDQAKSLLSWSAPWNKTLTTNGIRGTWFEGGKINACYNALDRHLPTRANKPAIIWEGEPGDKRTLTYSQLHQEVCTFASGLKQLGLKKSDIVTIYMPMVPELTIAVLACARLGITHSVIFAGFSAESIADRNNDAQAKCIITADGVFRKGRSLALKATVDKALETSPTIKHTVVLKRTNSQVSMHPGRDHWWHNLTSEKNTNCPIEPVDSEHPLFLLYTSGSTGKPKGIVHSTGGYLLGATLSCKYIFDTKENDIFWCTADVGWITGHSYVVYGPLSLGLTTVMYEGAPDTPHWGRFWEIIERYKVTKFYTAPTAIRAFAKFGESWPQKFDLSSLKLLGTVGEPISPKTWVWFHEIIGKSKCPIVDTWWQTETGSIMISPLPGVTKTKPGSCAKPFFGINPQIVNKQGTPVKQGDGGFLVIQNPWPSMVRTIYNDDERMNQQYCDPVPGVYFTGDGARQDEDGFFWILGRIDDVINVSGHRLSTMEIEAALVNHSTVAEAAVVGKPDEIKGEAISCFISLQPGVNPCQDLNDTLVKHVVNQIGGLAKPSEIRFTETLPKTRSGKIMRRFLRDIAAGRQLKGDTTTIEDGGVLGKIDATSPFMNKNV